VVIQHPEAVKQLQTEFARAGAEVLLACTYYAHEEKLKGIGVSASLDEINSQAVAIARQVAEEHAAGPRRIISALWPKLLAGRFRQARILQNWKCTPSSATLLTLRRKTRTFLPSSAAVGDRRRAEICEPRFPCLLRSTR
jgi:hypothetical protein